MDIKRLVALEKCAKAEDESLLEDRSFDLLYYCDVELFYSQIPRFLHFLYLLYVELTLKNTSTTVAAM